MSRHTEIERNLHSAVNLGQIAVGDLVRRLVADTKLETSRAPVDELNGALGLEGSDGSVGVVGNNVTAVEQAGGHVLAVAGVALDHLVVGLEAYSQNMSVSGIAMLRLIKTLKFHLHWRVSSEVLKLS